MCVCVCVRARVCVEFSEFASSLTVQILLFFLLTIKAYTTAAVDLFTNKLEYGPMPNVMAALPNVSIALCSTPQSFADAH